ncbi:hypothetical protein F4774DRAFT_381994 [Daldinia eschscholtzii]|nr:hypothetical protein F4774DRAFT_381994 [Daldinia eschscholtzii]
MPSRYIITLPNGQGLTAKQIELMSAVFQNASRDLLRTVDWRGVAAQTGHAQARIARDTFSRRCDVRGVSYSYELKIA